jgi:hypothetical protein
VHFCEDLHHANVLIPRREERRMERGELEKEEIELKKRRRKKRKVVWVVPGRLPQFIFNCINHFHGFLTGKKVDVFFVFASVVGCRSIGFDASPQPPCINNRVY